MCLQRLIFFPFQIKITIIHEITPRAKFDTENLEFAIIRVIYNKCIYIWEFHNLYNDFHFLNGTTILERQNFTLKFYSSQCTFQLKNN